MNQASRATTPLETPAGGRDPTILIVNDSPPQTERLCRALEGKAYQVRAAANGAEGLPTQLQATFLQTVEMATNLSGMRDRYTAGHERRVADIAVNIGAVIGLDANRQQGLRVAGLLHDVGKIVIQSDLLSKPGKLSAIQFKLIQRHTQVGYDVLKEVQFPWPVAEVALQHHERLNGSGTHRASRATQSCSRPASWRQPM